MFHGKLRYALRKSLQRVMELIRSKAYLFLEAPDSFPGTKRCFDYYFSMDIGDCNSEFLKSFSEDNPYRLTHFLLIFSRYKETALPDCNWMKLCATKTIQSMNRLNEKKLGTAPDNPSMGNINNITASTREKTESDTEQFRKFYGTYHKSVAADPVFHSTLPTLNIL